MGFLPPNYSDMRRWSMQEYLMVQQTARQILIDRYRDQLKQWKQLRRANRQAIRQWASGFAPQTEQPIRLTPTETYTPEMRRQDVEALHKIVQGYLNARGAKLDSKVVETDVGWGIKVGPRVFSVDPLRHGGKLLYSVSGKVFVPILREDGKEISSADYAAQQMVDAARGAKSSAQAYDRFAKATSPLPGMTGRMFEEANPLVREMLFNTYMFASVSSKSKSAFARATQEHAAAKGNVWLGYSVSDYAGGWMRSVTDITSVAKHPHLSGFALTPEGEIMSPVKEEKFVKTIKRAVRQGYIPEGAQIVTLGGRQFARLRVAFGDEMGLGGGKIIGSKSFMQAQAVSNPMYRRAEVPLQSLAQGFSIPDTFGHMGGQVIPLGTFGKEALGFSKKSAAAVEVVRRRLEIGADEAAINALTSFVGMQHRPLLAKAFGKLYSPEELMADPSIAEARIEAEQVIRRAYVASKLGIKPEDVTPELVAEHAGHFGVVSSHRPGIYVAAQFRKIIQGGAVKTEQFKGYTAYDPKISAELEKRGAHFMIGFPDVKSHYVFSANVARALMLETSGPYAQIGENIRQYLADPNLKSLDEIEAYHKAYSKYAKDISAAYEKAGWLPVLDKPDFYIPEPSGGAVMTKDEWYAIKTYYPELAQSIIAEQGAHRRMRIIEANRAVFENAQAAALTGSVLVDRAKAFRTMLREDVVPQLAAQGISAQNVFRVGDYTLPSVEAMMGQRSKRLQDMYVAALTEGSPEAAEKFWKAYTAGMDTETFRKNMTKVGVHGQFVRYTTHNLDPQTMFVGKSFVQKVARSLGVRPSELVQAMQQGDLYGMAYRFPSVGGRVPVMRMKFDRNVKSVSVPEWFGPAMFGDKDADPAGIAALLQVQGGKITNLPGAAKAFAEQPDPYVMALERLVSIGGLEDFAAYRAQAEAAAKQFGLPSPTTRQLFEGIFVGKNKEHYIAGYNPTLAGRGQNITVEDLKDLYGSQSGIVYSDKLDFVTAAAKKAQRHVLSRDKVTMARNAELLAKEQMGIYNMIAPIAKEIIARRSTVNQAFVQGLSSLTTMGMEPAQLASMSLFSAYQKPLDLVNLSQRMQEVYSKYNMLTDPTGAQSVSNQMVTFLSALVDEPEILPEAIGAIFANTPDDMRRVADWVRATRKAPGSTMSAAALLSGIKDYTSSIGYQALSAAFAVNYMSRGVRNDQGEYVFTQTMDDFARRQVESNPMFPKVVHQLRRRADYKRFALGATTEQDALFRARRAAVGAGAPSQAALNATVPQAPKGFATTTPDQQQFLQQQLQAASGYTTDPFVADFTNFTPMPLRNMALRSSEIGILSNPASPYFEDAAISFVGQLFRRSRGEPITQRLFDTSAWYFSRGLEYERNAAPALAAEGFIHPKGVRLVAGMGARQDVEVSGELDFLRVLRDAQGTPTGLEVLDTKTTTEETRGRESAQGYWGMQLAAYEALLTRGLSPRNKYFKQNFTAILDYLKTIMPETEARKTARDIVRGAMTGNIQKTLQIYADRSMGGTGGPIEFRVSTQQTATDADIAVDDIIGNSVLLQRAGLEGLARRIADFTRAPGRSVIGDKIQFKEGSKTYTVTMDQLRTMMEDLPKAFGVKMQGPPILSRQAPPISAGGPGSTIPYGGGSGSFGVGGAGGAGGGPPPPPPSIPGMPPDPNNLGGGNIYQLWQGIYGLLYKMSQERKGFPGTKPGRPPLSLSADTLSELITESFHPTGELKKPIAFDTDVRYGTLGAKELAWFTYAGQIKSGMASPTDLKRMMPTLRTVAYEAKWDESNVVHRQASDIAKRLLAYATNALSDPNYSDTRKAILGQNKLQVFQALDEAIRRRTGPDKLMDTDQRGKLEINQIEAFKKALTEAVDVVEQFADGTKVQVDNLDQANRYYERVAKANLGLRAAMGAMTSSPTLAGEFATEIGFAKQLSSVLKATALPGGTLHDLVAAKFSSPVAAKLAKQFSPSAMAESALMDATLSELLGKRQGGRVRAMLLTASPHDSPLAHSYAFALSEATARLEDAKSIKTKEQLLAYQELFQALQGDLGEALTAFTQNPALAKSFGDLAKLGKRQQSLLRVADKTGGVLFQAALALTGGDYAAAHQLIEENKQVIDQRKQDAKQLLVARARSERMTGIIEEFRTGQPGPLTAPLFGPRAASEAGQVRIFAESMKRAVDVVDKFTTNLDQSIKTTRDARKAQEEIVSSFKNLQSARRLITSDPSLRVELADYEDAAQRVETQLKGYLMPGGRIREYLTAKFGARKGAELAEGTLGEIEPGTRALQRLDRFMSGYFAWQTLRTLRYTFSPITQAGEEYHRGVMQTNALLGDVGLGDIVSTDPIGKYMRFRRDLQLGVGQQAGVMLGGLGSILGGRGGDVGRGVLGMLYSILSPAAGSAGITAMGLHAAGAGASLVWPAALIAATITGGIGLASWIKGASEDKESLMRGLMIAGRDPAAKAGMVPGFNMVPIGLLPIDTSDMTASSAYSHYLRRRFDVRVDIHKGIVKAHPYTSFDEMLHEEFLLDRGDMPKRMAAIFEAVSDPDKFWQFARRSPLAARLAMTSVGVQGTYLRKFADQYALTEDAAKTLAATVLSTPITPGQENAYLTRMAQIAQSGGDPGRMYSIASQYLAKRGIFQAEAAADYIASRPGLTQVDLIRRMALLEQGGGLSAAITFMQGQPYGNFNLQEALDVIEQRGAADYMTVLGKSVADQLARLVNLQVGKVMSSALGDRVAFLGQQGYTADQLFDAALRELGARSISDPARIVEVLPEVLASDNISRRTAFAAFRERMGGAAAVSRLRKLGLSPEAVMTAAFEHTRGMEILQSMLSEDPRMLTRMAAAGVVQPGSAMSVAIGGGFYDPTTGHDLFRRNLVGLFAPGVAPTYQQAYSFFQGALGARSQIVGAPSLFGRSGPAFTQRIINAAMRGGMTGLQMLSNQVSLEGALASAGISSASIREQYRYQTEFGFPAERANIAMRYGELFGGTVQTDWMRKHGIPAINFGIGDFARKRQELQRERAGMENDLAQRLARLNWQLEDLGRERDRSRITADWQRADFAYAERARWVNRNWQRYEFARGMSEFRIGVGHTREDFAFNRMISDLQFGWQMEDYAEAIKRSRGLDRRRLIRQRDRDTELYSLRQQQEDREKQRFEEKVRREEDHFRKQLEHMREIEALEDEEFKRQQERFEQQVAWREEDFSIREARIMQEIAWAQENAARSERAMKDREEQLRIEEEKAQAVHKMQLVLQDAQEAHAKKMYELQLASAGLAASQALKQAEINQYMEELAKLEEDRIAKFREFFVGDRMELILNLMREVTALAAKLRGQNPSAIQPQPPGTAPTPQPKPGDYKPSVMELVPQTNRTSGEYLHAVIQLGDQKIEEVVVPVVRKAVIDSVRTMRR